MKAISPWLFQFEGTAEEVRQELSGLFDAPIRAVVEGDVWDGKIYAGLINGVISTAVGLLHDDGSRTVVILPLSVTGHCLLDVRDREPLGKQR